MGTTGNIPEDSGGSDEASEERAYELAEAYQAVEVARIKLEQLVAESASADELASARQDLSDCQEQYRTIKAG